MRCAFEHVMQYKLLTCVCDSVNNRKFVKLLDGQNLMMDDLFLMMF